MRRRGGGGGHAGAWPPRDRRELAGRRLRAAWPSGAGGGGDDVLDGHREVVLPRAGQAGQPSGWRGATVLRAGDRGAAVADDPVDDVVGQVGDGFQDGALLGFAEWVPALRAGACLQRVDDLPAALFLRCAPVARLARAAGAWLWRR